MDIILLSFISVLYLIIVIPIFKTLKKKIVELLIKKIFYFVTQVDNINMVRQMLQEQFVFQNKNKKSKIFILKF